jgi:hypothetical protein
MHSERESPDHILDIGYAFRKSKALLSAIELGLFTALGDGPLDMQTVMARIGIHERGARDFLDTLVALDLLHRDDQGRYSNQPDSALYLDRRKQTYIGGPLEQLNSQLYARWGLLTQALRTGMPQSPLGGQGYRAFYADASAFEMFLKAMTGGSLMAAKQLAAKFPWHAYRTLIDIGTAQGCVPVEIACAHPHLRAGGFDLPQVEGAFTAYVSERGLSERLKFYPGDFLQEELPQADVLIMGRILHNWDLPTKRLLLQRVYRALLPGGVLIVYDALIDDTRRGPAHSLLASLNMLIETTGGFEYTAADCMSWMWDSGFNETRIERLGSRHTAIVATKCGR